MTMRDDEIHRAIADSAASTREYARGLVGSAEQQASTSSIDLLNVADFPSPQAAVDAAQPSSSLVYFGTGVFPLGQHLVLPATPSQGEAGLPTAISLVGSPGAHISSSITPAFENGIFDAGFGTFPLPGLENTGTVHANAAAGVLSLQLDMTGGVAPVVGQAIGVTHADTNVWYVVESVTGNANPYTVGLDRPTFVPWTAGDSVVLLAKLLTDFTFEGWNTTITGSAQHAVIVANYKTVRVSDLTISGRGLGAVSGVDLDGCQDAVLERISVDLTGAGQHGVTNPDGALLQGCERSTMRQIIVTTNDLQNGSPGAGPGAPTQYGPELSDCYQCVAEDCWSINTTNGLQFSTLNAAGVNAGCIDCEARGGGAIGAQVGLLVQGSTRGTFVGYKSRFSLAHGILVAPGPGGVPTSENRFLGCDATDAAERGVWVQNGCSDSYFSALDVSGAGQAGVYAEDDVTIEGLTAHRFSAASAVKALAGVKATLTDGHVVSTFAGAWLDLGGRRHEIRNVQLEAAGVTIVGSNAIQCTAGITYLENVTAKNAQNGVYVPNGSTVIIGPGCDFSACTNPVNVQPGGVCTYAGAREYVFGVATSDVGNVAGYLPPGSGATESATEWDIPVSQPGTIQTLIANVGTQITGAGGTLSFTLQKNGAPVAGFSVQMVTGGATQLVVSAEQAAIAAVPVALGDRLACKSQGNGAQATAALNVSVTVLVSQG